MVTPRQIPNIQPILLGIGFALLIAISAASVLVVRQASSDAEAVTRTLAVQDSLAALLLDIRRAESGQRGYLLTDRQEYLNDYVDAQPRIEPGLARLRELLHDNPERLPAMNEIERLTRAKIDELERTITLRQSLGREAALNQVLTDQGLTAMQQLRAVVIDIIAKEGQILASRSDASQQNNVRLLILTLFGSVMILAIGGLSIFLVQHTAKQRESARRELAATNENLEQIVNHRTADLTEANEEIQRFAYIVSHDLRSPLVNIMGFTTELETLRQDIFAEVKTLRENVDRLMAENANIRLDQRSQADIDRLGHDFDEAVGFIKTSINKMDRLINAVLKLSREGRREFHPQALNMNEVMDNVVRTVTHRALELGAEIAVDKDLPAVESDRLAIEQVFSNLVDNALKYLRDEPGRIEIKGRTTPFHVVYSVQDNGRGIDKADFQRVFELFRRAGQQDRPGEGIGLAHVRALVRRLGGSMQLESEINKGSTFTVTLPHRWSATAERSAA